MIKHIKTSKGEGLAVMVPDDATGFSLKKTRHGKSDQLHYFVPYTLDVVSNQRLVILPSAGYLFVGKSTELTEEQCVEIVECWYKSNLPYQSKVTWFTDYTDKLSLKPTAKESLGSLMQSIGAYSVNPFGEKPTETFNHPDWEFTRAKWEEAQKSVGTYLILKKL